MGIGFFDDKIFEALDLEFGKYFQCAALVYAALRKAWAWSDYEDFVILLPSNFISFAGDCDLSLCCCGRC